MAVGALVGAGIGALAGGLSHLFRRKPRFQDPYQMGLQGAQRSVSDILAHLGPERRRDVRAETQQYEEDYLGRTQPATEYAMDQALGGEYQRAFGQNLQGGGRTAQQRVSALGQVGAQGAMARQGAVDRRTEMLENINRQERTLIANAITRAYESGQNFGMNASQMNNQLEMFKAGRPSVIDSIIGGMTAGITAGSQFRSQGKATSPGTGPGASVTPRTSGPVGNTVGPAR